MDFNNIKRLKSSFLKRVGSFLLSIGISAVPLATWATESMDPSCLQEYINVAKNSSTVGTTLNWGFFGMILGGTVAGSSGFIAAPLATGIVVGGSTVGSVRNSYYNEAELANNIAKTILEAKANVIGPYTVQMAQSLN